jgi:hypothetical protein
MTLLKLTSINQSEIIEIFGGLPPDEYLSLELTEIQAANWCRVKGQWTAFKVALNNYFSGKYIFQDLPLVMRDSELFTIALQRYLSLYDLLNWGWVDIQNFHKDIEIPAEKPGQAFAYILREEATAQFLDEGKTSPRALYEAFKYHKHCQRLKKMNLLTPENIEKFQKLDRRVNKKNLSPFPEYVLFRVSCLEARRKSKDKTVRKKLKNLEVIDSEWADLLTSYLHPRKAGKIKYVTNT